MSNNLLVFCGLANHAIYITNKHNLLVNPVPITNQAIEAVRDYMVSDIKDGESSVGYQWKRADGKIVKMYLMIEDGEQHDTEGSM